MFFAALLVLVAVLATSNSFSLSSSGSLAKAKASASLNMEYIPDGLTKKQWAAIKTKEKDDAAKKKNNVLGAGKFKSRSFEAWHKSGAKHLFPVDPRTTPYEERPYMQRKDGDWEGKDLAKKGLEGKGQGTAYKRLELDGFYEKAKKDGKLDSVSIFGGASLPWTNEAASKVGKENDPSKMKGQRGVAGKKLSDKEMRILKANLAKVQDSSKEPKVEKPKKKFGIF